MCVCVCVCVCVRACVRACVPVPVCVSMVNMDECVQSCVYMTLYFQLSIFVHSSNAHTHTHTHTYTHELLYPCSKLPAYSSLLTPYLLHNWYSCRTLPSGYMADLVIHAHRDSEGLQGEDTPLSIVSCKFTVD